MRRTALSSLLLLAAPLVSGQAQNPPTGPLASVAIEQKIGSPLPLDAVFRDESGRLVPLRTFFAGRPVVLAFVYYRCPMLCSYVLEGTRQALRGMSLAAGKDFDLVAVSIDPADTAAGARVKKDDFVREYGRAGAETGVHFLTGEEGSIRRVAAAAGFRYVKDPETGEFAHAAGLFVVTPEGRVAKYFFGVEYAPRDLRLAIVEASSGRLGTPVDRFLLYCSHYDPATGRYTLAVLKVVRLAGIATVLLIGAMFLVFLRRERAA